MSASGPSTAKPPSVGKIDSVRGWRALIEFAPKPGSTERLCAGVVSRLDTGEVSFLCAIDQKKAEHAFIAAGHGLWHAARALCESLAEHWRAYGDVAGWLPPFESAKLNTVHEFSARDQMQGQLQLLRRVSSLHTLLDQYSMQVPDKSNSIVTKVRSAIRRDVNAKHLHKRFHREIHVGEEAGNLRVDFLGQRFACYFIQITQSTRGFDASTERAFGRLFELQALRRFIKKPSRSLGLFEDERPTKFELVMVADQGHSVQRRAVRMIEAIAEKSDIRAKPLPDVDAAADHVSTMEKRAA
jgi:hypothetical protein